MLCDTRYAGHFARVPRERWNDAMVPADEWLARDPKGVGDAIPYVLAVDPDDVLQRVIVDTRLMQMAARCRTFWHRLQEEGGIHNSHAEILVAREKARWDEAKAKELEALTLAAPQATKAPAAGGEAAEGAAAPGPPSSPPESAVPERNPDDAWIETARCPSCNECQTINDKMFTYNENKQAYIVDVKLGTYRQLVEAAEVCQVAIIHPGKPWNPNEPDLEALVARAEPFR